MSQETGPTGDWYKNSKNIEGILLDISGVLTDSVEGGAVPIEGSVDAVKKLKSCGVPVRLCTNETQLTKENIVANLTKFGFDVSAHEVFSPGPAMVKILQEKKLRPHLLVHENLLPEFASVDQSNPNCVVIGDAVHQFSYQNLNNAFRPLIELQTPLLFAMGKGKYYRHGEELTLDSGPFVRALEVMPIFLLLPPTNEVWGKFACDVEAKVVGKPSSVFFETAVKDIGARPESVLMVGDDIVNDIGGAKACGLVGVQVRTGKYRSSDEPHSEVTPDGYVDNLAQAVELFLKYRS